MSFLEIDLLGWPVEEQDSVVNEPCSWFLPHTKSGLDRLSLIHVLGIDAPGRVRCHDPTRPRSAWR